MLWIIIIFVVWAGVKLAVMEVNRDKRAEEKRKEAEERQKEEYKQNLNKPEVKKELFTERVHELNLNLDEAIYVLYCDDDGEAAFYKYLWYEDGALAMFNSVEMMGTWHLTTSPKEWKVYYFEKSNIDGVYRRNNYCQLNLNDGSHIKFSLNDYDAIKKLLTDNGLIQ